MRFDFSQFILNLDNQPIPNRRDPNNPRESAPPMSLSTVCVNALLGFDPQEDARLEGTEKLRRFNLAQKLYNGGWVEVTAEEVALLKTLVNRMYAPLIVGRVWQVLESNDSQHPATERVEKSADVS